MVHNPGEPIMTLFKSIFASGWAKFFGCILTGITTIFTPIAIAVACTFTFITFDTIYGYKVSRKNNLKHLESNKLWKTLNKFTEALIIITLASILDIYVIKSIDLHLAEIFSGAICFSEFISLLESFIFLSPNGPWKLLKKVIKSKGEKYLNVKMDTDNLNDKQNDSNDNKETV